MTTSAIRTALERLVELDSTSITMRSKSSSLAWADAIADAIAALAAREVEPSDTEDARLFCLWIREASERPGRLAQSICHCITPDQYRDVLRGFATATDIEDKLHGAQQPTQEEQ